MKFLRDLFAGVGNEQWDLGRIMAFASMLPMFAGLWWNIMTGNPIDMLAMGGGIAAVLTASAALIAAKDIARTNAISQVAKAASEAVVANAVADKVESETPGKRP